MIVDHSIRIAAPRAVVWAILTDVERWPEWTASMRSVQYVGAARLTLGGQVRIKQPGMPALVWEVTALVPQESFVASFETHIVPVLRAVGGALLGYYVTEPTANTFPQLPVREGEHVFVWIASFADEDAYAGYQIALTAAPDLKGWLSGPAEVLELAPTRRSLMRHPSTPDGAVIATAPRGRAVQGACPR